MQNIKKQENQLVYSTHTYIYTHIYIYIYVCILIYGYDMLLADFSCFFCGISIF